jgi:general stress protein YciG
VGGKGKMAEEKKTSGKEGKGKMTVQEAGKKGGMKTAQTHGKEFYEEIGHKGGQKVKELIEEGKKARSLSTR